MQLKSAQIPDAIKKYAFDKAGRKFRKFFLIQKGEIEIDIPWHEGDSATYTLWKLEGITKKNKIIVSRAGNSFTRSGMDGAETPSMNLPHGKFIIPLGFVVVAYHIYPQRVGIYTAADAPKVPEPENNILPASPCNPASLTV